MTDIEVKFRLGQIKKQMHDVSVLHKTEMRKMEDEIRLIQDVCRHPGEWSDRCPLCGKAKEVKA